MTPTCEFRQPHSLSRPRPTGWRAALGGFALCGALLVPAMAWTAAVPHPDFAAGDPISAAQMNENFAALVDQLSAVQLQAHGAIAISESSGAFQTQSDIAVAVPNAYVELDTTGGIVRLELTSAAGPYGARLWLGGTGGGNDPWLFGYVYFERSSDGESWEVIASPDFGGVPSASGSTAVPPGAFTAYDTPSAGTWFYRVTVSDYGGAGPNSTLHVDYVRLVAREVGVAP